jgi:hypothetical protein
MGLYLNELQYPDPAGRMVNLPPPRETEAEKAITWKFFDEMNTWTGNDYYFLEGDVTATRFVWPDMKQRYAIYMYYDGSDDRPVSTELLVQDQKEMAAGLIERM